ncbi:hypothetical protein F4780DRAFT_743542 [Xylariomycetidae sp. FL0641]|nr:hypothetical protein F4780DRAFT_743542 [Xylariomycetidae sp. FL0641]
MPPCSVPSRKACPAMKQMRHVTVALAILGPGVEGKYPDRATLSPGVRRQRWLPADRWSIPRLAFLVMENVNGFFFLGRQASKIDSRKAFFSSCGVVFKVSRLGPGQPGHVEGLPTWYYSRSATDNGPKNKGHPSLLCKYRSGLALYHQSRCRSRLEQRRLGGKQPSNLRRTVASREFLPPSHAIFAIRGALWKSAQWTTISVRSAGLPSFTHSPSKNTKNTLYIPRYIPVNQFSVPRQPRQNRASLALALALHEVNRQEVPRRR